MTEMLLCIRRHISQGDERSRQQKLRVCLSGVEDKRVVSYQEPDLFLSLKFIIYFFKYIQLNLKARGTYYAV